MTTLLNLYKFTSLLGSEPLNELEKEQALTRFGVHEVHFRTLALALPHDEFVEFIIGVADQNFKENISQQIDEMESQIDFLVECHNEPCEEHAEAARIKGLAQ